jgi:hypothetical protein
LLVHVCYRLHFFHDKACCFVRGTTQLYAMKVLPDFA